MEAITLNNGIEMPALGFGVFQTPPDETREAVQAALPVIGDIATAHGKSPAQVMLRWGLQQGRSVIPKSPSPAASKRTSTCSTSNVRRRAERD